MKNQTIHQRAVSLLPLYRSIAGLSDWRETHPSCPEWIAARIIKGKRRAAIRRAAKEAIKESRTPAFIRGRKDSWRRDDVDLLGAWATGLRRETGLTGHPLRALAHAMRDRQMAWGMDLRTASAIPDTAMGGIAGLIRSTGQWTDPNGTVWTADWAALHCTGDARDYLVCMALAEACRLDIGRLYGTQLLASLHADPAATCGGYLAATIADWLSGDVSGRAGYERCSGGEYMTWLRVTQPRSIWEWVLSRAPRGAATATAIQCYPHETARIARCREAGLTHTLRLTDSVYSGTPEQVAAVPSEAPKTSLAATIADKTEQLKLYPEYE